VRPKHYNIENALYFITTHCAEGVKPFRGGTACDAFITVLGQKQTVLGFGLYAYVLMPNHYHMILQLPEDVTIWKLMNHVNGASSRAVNNVIKKKYSHVWQGGFHDVVIRTAQEFAVKVNYIHDNPVAWKLVQNAEEYTCSSSQFYLKRFGSPYLAPQGFDDFALTGILDSIRTVL
jgi:putative transposase